MSNEFIARKGLIVSGSAIISGSATASAGFSGNLFGSASYATSASAANSITFNPLSSSYATTASYVRSASYAGTDWNVVNNKPIGIVSSSTQYSTGSYTGSFTGSLLGSSSYALSSSYARSASWAPGTAGGADWNTNLTNIPIGILSSSAQINLLANTSASWASRSISSSHAITASYLVGSIASASYAQFATSASYFTGSLTFPAGLIVTGSVTASVGYTGSFTGSLLGSSSYALSASWAPGGGAADFNTLLNKPTLVSSSAQVNTGSFTGSFIGEHVGSSSWASHSISSSYARSASYAGTDWNAINNKPTVFSSSVQINTGSFTGSFTGSLLGSASYALTSSAATSITFLPASASYANATTWNSVNNKPTVVSASSQVSTGSYTGSFTGALLGSASYAPTSWVDVNNKPVGILSGSTQINLLSGVSSSWASQSLSSSYAFSSSYALSASWSPGAVGGDFNTLVNKPTLVSSSAQVNTGSFTGSFTGNFLGSASYATTAATASYITASIGFPNGLIVTGSVTASAYTGSFTGSLLGSASYALSASWAPGGSSVSASYATTASSANDFFVRGQLRSYGAVNDSTNTALGDNALVAQYLNPAGSRNTAIGNWALWSNVSGTENVAVGHSALAFNVSGSKNSALGQNALGLNVSGDENTAVGYNALYSNIIGTTNTAIGRFALHDNVSGTNNTAVGASALQSLIRGDNNLAFGANALGGNISGSDNVALGSVAGYYETGSNTLYIDNTSRNSLYGQQTGSLIYGTFDTLPANQMLRINATVSASYKMYVAGGITGSILGSSSYALSSSHAVSASWAPGAAGGDFNTLVNKPTLVSSSAQVNTGSFTGSFTGNFLGSASYATMALTASYMTGSLNFSDGLIVTGSVTASIGYTGSFTGSLLGSSSYALSASYAKSASWAPGGGAADFNTLLNKPTLVSSSAQVNTGSFTGSFTGNFLGSASYATTASYFNGNIVFPNGLDVTGSVTASIGYTGSFTGSLLGSSSYALSASWAPGGSSVSASYAVTSSYATTAQNVLGAISSASWAAYAVTASYISGGLDLSSGLIVTGSVTASVGYTGSFTGSLLGSSSYATTAATASYVSGGLNFPNGLIVTGSVTASVGYTGSFTGSILGSSSYALSSSYAMSASWAPGGAGGGADWNTNLTNIPVGLVSSSIQVDTGSFTGSFTGSLSGSAIDYDRSTVRYQVLQAPTAGNYTASVTLSLGQHIYMTGSGAIGNTMWRIADERYNRTDGFVLTIASGGIRTHTWPKGDANVSASWPGGINPTLTPSGGWDTIVFTTTPTNDWDGVVVKRDSR